MSDFQPTLKIENSVFVYICLLMIMRAICDWY